MSALGRLWRPPMCVFFRSREPRQYYRFSRAYSGRQSAGAFSEGQTVQDQIKNDVDEVHGGFSIVESAPTLSDLTTSLNALGVSCAI